MELHFDIENMLNSLADFEIKSKEAIELYADVAGRKLEAEAKQNGEAKGLRAETIEGGKEWEGDKCVIYVAGNTPNFPKLELTNDKKDAVLKPSLDKLSSEIMSNMNNLLGG